MTVHFQSNVWIEPQLEYLRRNCAEPIQTWAILDGVDPAYSDCFDHVVEFEGTHPQRLNELAAPFSDDPAFQALLKLERETQGREGGDAAG